jgi:hypothetical protein
MRKPEHRQKIAEALYKGIAGYAETLSPRRSSPNGNNRVSTLRRCATSSFLREPKMRKYPVITLFASVLLGQNPTEPNVDRTFYFTQATTPQGFQEAATAIRSSRTFGRQRSTKRKNHLAVQAPADQVALAQWLYNELDQKAPSLGDDPSSREYRIPGNDDEVVRIFYRTRARTPQELVEQATVVRSIVNMRQVFTYNDEERS